jgi:ABC-type nitrate/sulfonate/bicarbonate transport system permease component
VAARVLTETAEGVEAEAVVSEWSRRLRDVVPPIALIAGVIALWQALVVVGGLREFVLPAPGAVVRAGWDTRAVLAHAVAVTLLESAIGLAIALVLGVMLAAAMDFSPLIRRALYPILVASQTVQILAVAPLLIIWFGFGLAPKVIIVVLMCFFPLAVSTADGLTSTDPDAVALMRSMGARRRQIWLKARLPSALPSFFSGLRLAVTYAVVAATIGEWVGGTDGLGMYMFRSKNAWQTDQVFAAMLITTLLSIGLFALVWVLDRLALPWYHAPVRTAQWEAETGS